MCENERGFYFTLVRKKEKRGSHFQKPTFSASFLDLTNDFSCTVIRFFLRTFNVLTHQITVKWLSSECSLLSAITAGPITVFYCIYTSLRGEKLSWREILRAISHLTAESFKSAGISDESDDGYEAAARFSDLFSEECLPKLCLINTDFLLRNFQTSSDCLKKKNRTERRFGADWTSAVRFTSSSCWWEDNLIYFCPVSSI